MNYAYNIKVNLKRKLYNFYEWSKKDKIETLNKINIFKVSDSTLKDIINMEIKVNEKFLNNIKNDKKICVFCSDIDSICIRFNNKGIIDLISKLDLEEEREILDETSNYIKYDLKYEKINKSNNYLYITRDEEEKINIIKNYLEINKDDNNIIDYLYYEWFNDSKNSINKYDKLLKEINNEFSNKHNELYEIIELITCIK